MTPQPRSRASLSADSQTRQEPRAPLVDVGALAAELGVSRAYVYEHADELGALRLGKGPKAPLRFDPVAVRAALSCSGSERSQSQNPSAGGASQQAPAPRGRRWPSHRPQPAAILPSRPRKARDGE
jgi:hypothetical protein